MTQDQSFLNRAPPFAIMACSSQTLFTPSSNITHSLSSTTHHMNLFLLVALFALTTTVVEFTAAAEPANPDATGTPWENLKLAFYVKRNENFDYSTDLQPDGDLFEETSTLEVFCADPTNNNDDSKISCSCFLRVIGFQDSGLQRCDACGYCGSGEDGEVFLDCRNVQGVDTDRARACFVDDCESTNGLHGLCRSSWKRRPRGFTTMGNGFIQWLVW